MRAGASTYPFGPVRYRRLSRCVCGRKPRWRWRHLESDWRGVSPGWRLSVSCACGRRLIFQPVAHTGRNLNRIIREWNRFANDRRLSLLPRPEEGYRSWVR